jgi:hypothetical protein
MKIDTSVFVGKTADEIAAYFKAEGLLGPRDTGWKCPLAKWLQRETGNPKANVGIRKGFDTFIDAPIVVFPPQVEEFVWNFLDGKYPFLSPEVTS